MKGQAHYSYCSIQTFPVRFTFNFVNSDEVENTLIADLKSKEGKGTLKSFSSLSKTNKLSTAIVTIKAILTVHI